MNAALIRRIVIPAQPNILIDRTSFEEIERRFREGDAEITQKVQATLNAADRYVSKGEGWAFDLISTIEPRGLYTCACPIHPFQVRYYSYFRWSIDDPWRLHCPLCEQEGRKYPFYPNPRYPDDGDGCRPSDEVWGEDHTPGWSKAHRGIPWDRWDGEAHGYMEPTDAFYFTGLCVSNIFTALCYDVIPKLGAAYHYAVRLEADAVGKAGAYARQAKRLLVTLSRAFLGDAYLSAILDVSQEALRDRLTEFYGTRRIGRYPGYRLVTIDDCIEDGAGRPLSTSRYRAPASRFPGAWNAKASCAEGLLSACCLAAETFTEAEIEAGLRDIAERIVTSSDGDEERLRRRNRDLRLKRGIVEHTLHPYHLVTGADNLSSSTQHPRLDLALMLGNDELVETVARDILCFFRNFFTGDGMGREGAPSYTASSFDILDVAARLQGLAGAFNRKAPYVDPATGTLDLLGTPLIRETLAKFVRCAFPDGRLIPWEDSLVYADLPVDLFDLIDRLAPGLPASCAEHFRRNGDGKLELVRPLALKSSLLHENRKGLLRSGAGGDHRIVSLDYTERVSHYHLAPLNLLLYAKGHELAPDLGYMGSLHYLTTQWIRTFPAHNTLVLRDAKGDPAVTGRLRGDLRRFFKALPAIQAMDAAELDPAELAHVPGERPVYGRTVALIDVDEKDSYVLDVFRARGGASQDLFFHAAGRKFEVRGIDLLPHADPDADLYAYSGFAFECGDGYGEKNVNALQVGASSGPWTATWGEMAEWPSKEGGPEIDPHVFLRWHVLDAPGSEVIAGSAPAQRWLDNRDLGERMTLVCVRRRKTDLLQNYVSVLEPYRGRPFIRRVERLRVTPEQESAVALKVVLPDRTDYLLSACQGDPPVEVRVEDEGHVITTDGELALASFGPQGLRSLTVIAGTHLTADGESVLAPPSRTGRLLDFDDIEKTLVIESEDPIPIGDRLRGEVIQILHREERSSFTIETVRDAGEKRFEVALSESPHLVMNVLRVVGVEEDGVWVEPPPVLPPKPNDLVIYKVLRDGSLSYLAHWRGASSEDVNDEWGCRIRIRHRIVLKGVEPLAGGEEIALSFLDAGRDRFLLTGSGYKMF
ncbi:MAG: hypothetical protein EXS64_21205 [Candidatus Latescibacteria bacterium]|nr:hypothetical protein [Candidatus Latescibacterota bacterium]